MPIGYRIDTARGFGVAVWYGRVTDNEIVAHDAKIRTDPDWPPRLLVTDITSVTEMADLAAMVQLGKDVAARTGGIRVAIIAAKEFAAARGFERDVAPAGLDVIVFNELGIACAWLGVDVATLQPMVSELRSELARRPDTGPNPTS